MNRRKVKQLKFDLVSLESEGRLELEIRSIDSSLAKISVMRKEYKEIERQILKHQETATSSLSCKFIDVDFSQHKYLLKNLKFKWINMIRCKFHNLIQIKRLIKISPVCEQISFLSCSFLEDYLKSLLLMKLKKYNISFEENGFELGISNYSVSIKGDLNLSTHAKLHERCLALFETQSVLGHCDQLDLNYSNPPIYYTTDAFRRWFLIPTINTYYFSGLNHKGFHLGSWLDNNLSGLGELKYSQDSIKLETKEDVLYLPKLIFDYISPASTNLIRFLLNPPLRSLAVVKLTLSNKTRHIRAMEYLSIATSSMDLETLHIDMWQLSNSLVTISQTWTALRQMRGVKTIDINAPYLEDIRGFFDKYILGRMHLVSARKWWIGTELSENFLDMRPGLLASEPRSKFFINEFVITSIRPR